MVPEPPLFFNLTPAFIAYYLGYMVTGCARRVD